MRGEPRTRAPSRLSRMWTALLLARLGEISIVLHAGCGALNAKRRVELMKGGLLLRLGTNRQRDGNGRGKDGMLLMVQRGLGLSYAAEVGREGVA